MKSDSQPIEVIFNAARQLKLDERHAYLDMACKNDAALRKRVERLRDSSNAADDFFEQEPVGATDIEDVTQRSITGACSLSESPGPMIGRYKLLQKIGEGGMGVVYMAEQTEPVTRRVALKIIKLCMDTKQVVARFEVERQVLAMMDHANIAKVLDGGATETGRPFFVMELVQGIPITEFCDKNKFSAQERLELFIPICQAIQSAHQKGIIHRDIKPSNVLVTLNHGEPAAKVIDFGIAKATNQKLTEKTLFTSYAMMIGTPAYMSPEQAEMTSLDVDTRTDVYSLGVLLYELLTGITPFPEKRLRSAGYGEMQRIIVTEEPEKPSTRLNKTLAASVASVANPKSKIANPKSRIDPDLDWITMKCLEKDRRRRYETPTELVSDLKRHLYNEPVSAAAPSLSYQFHKFHRKHKVLVRSAMIVSAVLVVATVVSVTLAVRNHQLRKDAEVAKQSALERSIELENNLYVSDMLAVEDAVESEEFIRAKQLLLQHRSEPSGRDLRGFEWRFYWPRTHGEQLNSIQAHDGEINRRAVNRSEILQIQILDNGRQLVTGGNDGEIKLWNLSDNQLVQEWDSRSRFAISPK